MRLYTWGNMYLSSIQQGIQALHSSIEMFVDYADDDSYKEEYEQLIEWASDYKTVICLNGGESSNLLEIVNMFQSGNCMYPWSYFYEEKDAINSALTNVCIVVPAKIYETIDTERRLKNKCLIENARNSALSTKELSEFDLKLIDLIKTSHMAR